MLYAIFIYFFKIFVFYTAKDAEIHLWVFLLCLPNTFGLVWMSGGDILPQAVKFWADYPTRILNHVCQAPGSLAVTHSDGVSISDDRITMAPHPSPDPNFYRKWGRLSSTNIGSQLKFGV